MIRRLALAALAAALLVGCRAPGPTVADAAPASTAVAQGARAIVESPSGRARTVRLEVVRTPADMARGLMFRERLGDDEGMLFVFPDSSEHVFWMKNTLLPLDMIFIDGAGSVVGVVERAEPQTLTPRTVGAPSRLVLEVIGGWSATHGVAKGDRVRFEGVEGI
jgi:uncharacterized protein